MAHPGLYEDQDVAPVAAITRSTQQPNATPVATSEDAGLGRAFVRGSIVGAVAMFVLLGGMALAVGMGNGAALGVGAFTAFWGGPGFGGMMGAVLHYSRTEAT
jgi:hypothetical protein